MFTNFTTVFLLLVPGLIATEIDRINLRVTNGIDAFYFIRVLLYSFIILGLNVLLKSLLGDGADFFLLTTEPFYTDFLVKYIISSLLFAVLLPLAIAPFITVFKKIVGKINV
jgi:hypothetical protein